MVGGVCSFSETLVQHFSVFAKAQKPTGPVASGLDFLPGVRNHQ